MKTNKTNKIYTHNIAANILEEFEEILYANGVVIPDDERTGEESEACLYGDTYSNLLYNVECYIIEALKELKDNPDSKIIEGLFE